MSLTFGVCFVKLLSMNSGQWFIELFERKKNSVKGINEFFKFKKIYWENFKFSTEIW